MGNSSRRRTGSVRVQPNGRYLARIQCGVTANGKPRVSAKTFDSESDANAWLIAQSVRMTERPDMGAGITLSALWKVYKANRLPELAATTQKTYKQRMAPVIERMGKRDISSITHGEIQHMFDGMRPSIAKRTNTVLSAVMTYGVRNGLLAQSPLYRAPFTFGETSPFAAPESEVWDTDPFAAIESRRDVWDAPTISKCMGMIRGLALEPVWLCCVGAGVRVEEAFALRRMDVRRIVGSFDELGNEIWVTQLAIHHATTREESRKSTKTTRSVGIVPMLEPFGERYWEIVQRCGSPDETICKLSAARQNKTWRAYFEEPPEEWHKRMSEDRKVQGRLHGLPYIPLSRMRATHTTLVQEAGVLDSINRSWHRNTQDVQQRHYMRPDVTETSVQVSRMLNF